MNLNRILASLKAIAALIGAVATALLAIYGPETDLGKWLVVASVVATGLVTYRVPNLDPQGELQAESVQPPAEGDDPLPFNAPFTNSH